MGATGRSQVGRSREDIREGHLSFDIGKKMMPSDTSALLSCPQWPIFRPQPPSSPLQSSNSVNRLLKVPHANQANLLPYIHTSTCLRNMVHPPIFDYGAFRKSP
jgi:hypothetical protein